MSPVATPSKPKARAAKSTTAHEPASRGRAAIKAAAALTISSKNYSSWSLRGWLLARFAGLEFDEVMVPPDDARCAPELLLLSPSILVPCLTHDGIKVWDTLAIAEYLNEIKPEAGLLPADRAARAHCRAICGEMHSGFANLRSALPMNLKAHFPGLQGLGARAGRHRPHRRRSGASASRTYGGPYLFGAQRCMADAMYAPVVTRFLTYDVPLDAAMRGLLQDASWRCPR